MNDTKTERRSELSQSIRACMATELSKHEIKEKAWLEQHKQDDIAWLADHELKDIAAHNKVCEKPNDIASEQGNIKDLINEVKSVWDGIGAVGRGIIWTAKVFAGVSVITGGLWAVLHFGHRP